MKITTRTTLPNNPYEHPVYEVKRSIFFKWSVYFAVATVPAITCYLWWFLYFNLPLQYIIEPGQKIGTLVLLVMVSLICILWIAIVAALGDVYFYEGHVEIRRFLPFMKRQVIYYEKMHVHMPTPMHTEYYEKMDIHMPLPMYIDWTPRPVPVVLNHYETSPKLWKSPYAWLKAYHSESIGFSLASLSITSNPEVMEFLKKKAKSVNYE